jgi:gas vesicle protein
MENPYIKTPPAIKETLGNFNTNDFLKGALIGAVATYLLTNENAQKAIFKTFAKGSQLVQAGIEEMKERMEDAKAEMEAQQG